MQPQDKLVLKQKGRGYIPTPAFRKAIVDRLRKGDLMGRQGYWLALVFLRHLSWAVIQAFFAKWGCPFSSPHINDLWWLLLHVKLLERDGDPFKTHCVPSGLRTRFEFCVCDWGITWGMPRMLYCCMISLSSLKKKTKQKLVEYTGEGALEMLTYNKIK